MTETYKYLQQKIARTVGKLSCADCKAFCCKHFSGVKASKQEMKAMKRKAKEMKLKKLKFKGMGYNMWELKYKKGGCPFLVNDACPIYDKRPRTCALYPVKLGKIRHDVKNTFIYNFELDRNCTWVKQNEEKLKKLLGGLEFMKVDDDGNVMSTLLFDEKGILIDPETYMMTLAAIVYIFGSKKLFHFLRTQLEFFVFLKGFRTYSPHVDTFARLFRLMEGDCE